MAPEFFVFALVSAGVHVCCGGGYRGSFAEGWASGPIVLYDGWGTRQAGGESRARGRSRAVELSHANQDATPGAGTRPAITAGNGQPPLAETSFASESI